MSRFIEIKDKLHEIYFWSKKHPIYSSSILFTPNAYFTLLQICPEKIYLKVNNEITSFGMFLFWFLLVVSFVLIVGKELIGKEADEMAAATLGRQREVMESATYLINLKKERFIRYIQNNIGKNNCAIFPEITEPKDQLKALCDYIMFSLSALTGVDKKRIGVSIFIQDGNKWKMEVNSNVDSYESAQKLMSDSETACYNTKNSKDGLVFYPEKEAGEREKKYKMNRKDFENKKIGSIICKDISIVIENDIILNAILNISTYGQTICPQSDESAKYKIIDDILPSYVNRAQLELSLLYIKKYIFRKGANCPNKKAAARKPRQNTNVGKNPSNP